MKQKLYMVFSLLAVLGFLIGCPGGGPTPPTPTPTVEYVVTFHRNVLGEEDQTFTMKVKEGEKLVLPSIDEADPFYTRSSTPVLKPIGWASQDIARKKEFSPGQSISVDKDLDLYTFWARLITLKFDSNTGTGTMDDLEVLEGDTILLPPSTFTHTTPTKGFSGWGTTKAAKQFNDQDSFTVTFDDNGKIVINDTISTNFEHADGIILYAIWADAVKVIFHAMNDTGVTTSQTILSGVDQVLDLNTFTYTGMEFVGWADWSDFGMGIDDTDDRYRQVGGIKYKDGDTVNFAVDTDLYAVWKGFKKIEGGTFVFGSNSNTNNMPLYEVTLNHDFEVSTHEVTQAEWVALTGYKQTDLTGDSLAENNGSLPIATVSWYQAIVYCNKLSIAEGKTPCYSIAGWDNEKWQSLDIVKDVPHKAQAGIEVKENDTWKSVTCDFTANGYRLPTEAEFEYVGKYGSAIQVALADKKADGYDAKFIWSGMAGTVAIGSDNNPQVPDNLADELKLYAKLDDGTQVAEPVMSFRSNSLKIYDLTGNVNEWLWDYKGTRPTETSLTDPTGPETGTERHFRGGAYNSGYAGNAPQVSFRGLKGAPVHLERSLGFRLYRTVEGSITP